MAEHTFDKFKSSLNRGIATISVKTSSSLEKSKLRTHIESLKNEIQKLYLEVGEVSFTQWMNHDENSSVLEGLFSEIQAKQNAINELSEELNSIDERDNKILGLQTEKTAIICPQCGAAYTAPAKFCRSCGFKMQE